MLIICQTLMTGYGLNSYHFVITMYHSYHYVYWTAYIGPLRVELKNGTLLPVIKSRRGKWYWWVLFIVLTVSRYYHLSTIENTDINFVVFFKMYSQIRC